MKTKKLRVRKTVVRSLTRNEMTVANGGRITWSSNISSACASGVLEGAISYTHDGPNTNITCYCR